MGRGFQRHDFIGGGGPGLAKLRALNIAAPKPATALHKRKNSLLNVRALMAAGQWPDAILAACRFQDLGDEEAAIRKGREAILRPRFQMQLGGDPLQLIDEAKAALQRRYGK